ncbi:MAG TPA: methionine gamma-lyase family protein [Clostridia bacterium]
MKIEQFIEQAEKKCLEKFIEIEKIALQNQQKVLDAFRECKIGLQHFNGSTGYGYGDSGREKLNELYARVFNTPKAIVSPHIMSGTHALALCLYGILRPGDLMVSITGKLYDTLEEIVHKDGCGSLKDFGIKYAQIDLINGEFDYQKIERFLTENNAKMVFIQRSRGYEWSKARSMSQIKDICDFVRKISPNSIIMVDNCYGEFVDTIEPFEAGADIFAGSLIKNPGGGIAPTGGYICGREDLIDLVAGRLTTPNLRDEIGSYTEGYRLFFQGLFLAPHVVGQVQKGSLLIRRVFSDLGFKVLPAADENNYDIITSIEFDDAEKLIEFHRTIQYCSPVDSYVTLYPWDMPGYTEQVIMAAGTFVQGSSIELSSDSPIKKPYIAYLQGGLTYEHIKIALMMCLERLKLI